MARRGSFTGSPWRQPSGSAIGPAEGDFCSRQPQSESKILDLKGAQGQHSRAHLRGVPSRDESALTSAPPNRVPPLHLLAVKAPKHPPPASRHHPSEHSGVRNARYPHSPEERMMTG
jgi:hypothetical protein